MMNEALSCIVEADVLRQQVPIRNHMNYMFCSRSQDSNVKPEHDRSYLFETVQDTPWLWFYGIRSVCHVKTLACYCVYVNTSHNIKKEHTHTVHADGDTDSDTQTDTRTRKNTRTHTHNAHTHTHATSTHAQTDTQTHTQHTQQAHTHKQTHRDTQRHKQTHRDTHTQTV